MKFQKIFMNEELEKYMELFHNSTSGRFEDIVYFNQFKIEMMHKHKLSRNEKEISI